MFQTNRNPPESLIADDSTTLHGAVVLRRGERDYDCGLSDAEANPSNILSMPNYDKSQDPFVYGTYSRDCAKCIEQAVSSIDPYIFGTSYVRRKRFRLADHPRLRLWRHQIRSAAKLRRTCADPCRLAIRSHPGAGTAWLSGYGADAVYPSPAI